jgi:ADP-ribosylglycohydrolase
MTSKTLGERTRCTLLASAIGDAFGSALERGASLSPPLPAWSYAGPEWVIGPLPGADEWPSGRITAHTQQLLFCCEGVVRFTVRGHVGEKMPDLDAMLRWSMLRWHLAQTNPAALKPRAEWSEGLGGWLGDQELMRARRSRQRTAHAALAAALRPRVDLLEYVPQNSSIGAGCLIRSIALGCFAAARSEPDELVGRLGHTLSRLTHGGRLAGDSAAALAVIIRARLQGDSLATAIRRSTAAAGAGMDSRLSAGLQAIRDGITEECEDRTAVSVLLVALDAAAHGKDFRETLEIAGRMSRASGIACAVAGAVRAANGRVSTLPGDWLAGLEGRALIEQVALDLDAALTCQMSDSGPAETRLRWLANRYPGV